MQAERDALVRRCFPQLRTLVGQGGRSFQEVDLRWGVTTEEAEAGEVLRICLDEIDACRPHFCLILGGRYGWVDPEAPARLRRYFPHLEAFADRSVTELEVRHACLNPPPGKPPANCRVYVRQGFLDEAREEDRSRIQSLLVELEQSGWQHRLYDSPERLADWVVDDYRQELLASSPESSLAPRALEFLAQHPASNRSDLLRKSVHAMRAPSARVALVGGEGVGKSALAAAIHREESASGRPSFICAIDLEGGRWSPALRALPLGLKNLASREDVRDAFHGFLRRFEGLVILDGVDSALEPAADWLPHRRSKAKLLATARGNSLRPLGFKCITVNALNRTERFGLVRAYLLQFGKLLSNDQNRMFSEAALATSPLRVRLLCELLRQVGLFEELDVSIRTIGSVRDETALWDEVLNRLRSSQKGDVDLAPRALKIASLTRWGLTDAEAMHVLQAPIRDWAPIRTTLAFAGVVRGAAFQPVAPALRATVDQRSDIADVALSLRRLVALLLEAPLSPRCLDEAPSLLLMLEDWTACRRLLTAPDWLRAAADRDLELLLSFASEAAKRGSCAEQLERAWLSSRASLGALAFDLLRAIEAWRALATISDVEPPLAQDYRVEALFRLGDVEGALYIAASDIEGIREKLPLNRLLLLAALALEVGAADAAERWLRDAGRARPTEGAKLRLEILLSIAAIHKGRARLGLKQLQSASARARRNGYAELQAMALGGQALALRTLGRLQQAEGAYRTEAAIWAGLNATSRKAAALANVALCLSERDRFDDADRLLLEASGLCVHGSVLHARIMRTHADVLARSGAAPSLVRELRSQAQEFDAARRSRS